MTKKTKAAPINQLPRAPLTWRERELLKGLTVLLDYVGGSDTSDPNHPIRVAMAARDLVEES